MADDSVKKTTEKETGRKTGDRASKPKVTRPDAVSDATAREVRDKRS